MLTIYFATSNLHKVQELQAIIAQTQLAHRVLAASTLGDMPTVEENGDSYEENARIKALALAQAAPEESWVLAEDSGLAVDALGGRPGVHSARFAGTQATAMDNNLKLLRLLQEVPVGQRQACFHCTYLLHGAPLGERVFTGEVTGEIATELRGEAWGYDPLFIPTGEDKTFAELGERYKNRISHRARAVAKLVRFLQES